MTDTPAERDELREKLRHLTRDPGPLGSAVCALLKAAEAELPVMVMPDESRAIIDLLATQEAREPEAIERACGCEDAGRLRFTAREWLRAWHKAGARELLGAPAPAEATERCSFPGCGAASTGKLDGSVPLCDEHARAVGVPASGEPSGADAAVREAWRSVTDSLPKPGAEVIAGYRDTAGRWRSVRAVYAAARSVVCTCELDGDCLCEMDDTGESWWPEGWYEIADNADDVSAWRIGGTVTHWMPLPAPPGEEELAAEAVVREALDALDMAWELLIHAAPNVWANGNTSPTGIDEGEVRTANAISDIEAVLRKHGRLPTAPGAPGEGAGE